MDDEIEGTVKNGEINSFFPEFTLSLNFTRENYRATMNIRLKSIFKFSSDIRKNKKENSFKIDISI